MTEHDGSVGQLVLLADIARFPAMLVHPTHARRFVQGKEWEIRNSRAGINSRKVGDPVIILETGVSKRGSNAGCNRLVGWARWGGMEGPFFSLAMVRCHKGRHHTEDSEIIALRRTWKPWRQEMYMWKLTDFQELHGYARHSGGQTWTYILKKDLIVMPDNNRSVA